MNPGVLLAAVAGALLTSGIWLAISGLRRVPALPAGPARRRDWAAWSRPWSRPWSRQGRALHVGLGLCAGLVLGVFTGWWVAALLLPIAVIAIPPVLMPVPSAHIARIEALEEWSRSLAGVLTAGVGLEQAIIITLRSTPPAIRAEVATLVARFHARWPTEDALRAFADDLDDATGDLVAAKLVLASRRRGPGLASVLESLAESVAADVRTRRQIQADRDKPRATVRWVCLITIAALVVLFLNPVYTAPYHTPIGQLVLALLLGCDLALLMWMHTLTAPKPLPRFMGRAARARIR